MARFNVTVVDNEINVVSETATDIARAEAQSAAAEAVAAAQVASSFSGPYYATTGAYFADSPVDGEEFAVRVSVDATSADIYLNDGGVAVFARTIIIAPGDSGAAAMIGTTAGFLQSVLDDFEARITALEP